MIHCLILVLGLYAGSSWNVALDPRVFPDDFSLAFGSPCLFRVYRVPPFEIKKRPVPASTSCWYGWIPVNPLEGTAFLVTCEGGEARLYLDRNQDLDFTDDSSPLLGTALRSPPHLLLCFPRALLPGQPPVTATVRIEIEETSGKPVVGSLFRRHWREGALSLEGESFRLYLFDHDGSGAFTAHDLWTVVPATQTLPPESRAQWFPIDTAVLLPGGNRLGISRFEADGSKITVRILGPDEPAGQGDLKEILFPPPRLRAERTLAWRHAYDAACLLAGKEKKPILLLLTAPGCAYSRALLEQTFCDADVVDLMSEMIPLQIEVTETTTVPERFSPPGLPYIYFLNDQKQVLRRIPGYVPPERLSREIRDLLLHLR